MNPRRRFQPFLNEEEVVIVAPTQVWSDPTGAYGDKAIHGLYHGDWRFLRAARLRIDARVPEPAGASRRYGGRTSFGLARSIDGNQADPRVLTEWTRQVAPGRVTETVVLRNGQEVPVHTAVELSFEVEFTQLQHIKADDPHPAACRYEDIPGGVLATDGERSLRLTAEAARIVRDGGRLTVTLDSTVPAHGTCELTVCCEVNDPTAVIRAGSSPIADLPGSGDAALDRWSRQALDDCRALLLDAGDGAFLAAGTPWFLTLFGRDSLIAARFLLPVAPELAISTLRTLAARQGVIYDPATAEQPGKILHEVRAGVLSLPGEGIVLPPVYYGTVDATGLWIILLCEAWKAGVGDERIEPLLGNLERALAWLRDDACPGDSGFLRYFDATGVGLANQGWKDSGDSVRFGDGRLATGSIALAEVQAQACQAAESGAELLAAFGRDGSPWRAWAAAMRDRFRAAFWVERDGQRFPAIALDGDDRPVDSRTSNIGQLIGTTLLSPGEEAQLARLLLEPRFASGFGLRTMASDEAAYWPLSYHCGSVWVHDTAVAVEGMLRAGLTEPARELARQLVRAADAFGSRAPELFAGFSELESSHPVSYPASCRPQGWAAAAVVPAHRALTTRTPQ